MSASAIIAALALPPEARVDERVPKKMLVEQSHPTAADKRQILEGIDELLWLSRPQAQQHRRCRVPGSGSRVSGNRGAQPWRCAPRPRRLASPS